jgi:hypothetical protein
MLVAGIRSGLVFSRDHQLRSIARQEDSLVAEDAGAGEAHPLVVLQSTKGGRPQSGRDRRVLGPSERRGCVT